MPPNYQVCQILWADHIKELASSWQADIVDSQQQFKCQTQAIVDMEAVIHLRIVNQPFPPTVTRGFSK